tara:strand:+ start:3040 stop:3447 length:408 start_codon:yes stop_codon:yes gene_type:complete
MANITREIRSVLETQLASVTDVPQIAYENVPYEPTTGTSYIQVNYLPTSRRPAVRGLNPTQRYEGIFVILCYAPEGKGPAAAEAIAENVMSAFEATTSLTTNNTSVSIDYSEVKQGYLDSPWFVVPVNIGWYAYN